MIRDMDSLLGYHELMGNSILFCASGLSRIYTHEYAPKIWGQLHCLITGCYNTAILTDHHPEFHKLIEAESHYHEIKEKYGVVLPSLNDTKISHIDLDKC